MTGGLLLALLLAAQPAVAAAEAPPVELGIYREIITASSWMSCCAVFRGGVPGIERRIERAGAALERRYGQAAVAAAVAAARADFEEEFGTYDPVGRRLTPGQQQRERGNAWRWYDARLDALEARLGLAGR
jgi:hypothetical protein